jgi:hypothetical protein
MSDRDPKWLVLAAAQSATEAAAELLRATREDDLTAIDGDAEPIEKLLDAAKMAMEVVGDFSDERGQVYAALAKYLEGWVP